MQTFLISWFHVLDDICEDAFKFRWNATASISPSAAGMEYIPCRPCLIKTTFARRVVTEAIDHSIPQGEKLPNQLPFTSGDQIRLSSFENHKATQKITRLETYYFVDVVGMFSQSPVQRLVILANMRRSSCAPTRWNSLPDVYRCCGTLWIRNSNVPVVLKATAIEERVDTSTGKPIIWRK